MSSSRRQQTNFGWLLGSWTAIVLMVAFFEDPIQDRVGVLTMAIWLVLAVAGVALLLLAGVRAWHLRTQSTIAAIGTASLATIGIWFIVPYVSAFGSEWHFSRHFDRLRPEYERIVNQATIASSPVAMVQQESGGIRYMVDSGPPLRVAFPQPGGDIDNWEGVVYDPSGLVATAVAWRGTEFTAAPEIVKVFGGDLVGCLRIDGDFYQCWFT